MNKIKLIGMIAGGLLLSNLLLIGFILTHKPRPPLRDGPKKIIAQRLHFDETQLKAYDQLIATHQGKIKSLDSVIRISKNELYNSINSENTMVKDSMINKLGKFQMEVEKMHYAHFLDIKHICKSDQMTDFNALLLDVGQLFPGPNGKQKK